jgi:alkylated DNA repair dioxygenase AlkB
MSHNEKIVLTKMDVLDPLDSPQRVNLGRDSWVEVSLLDASLAAFGREQFAAMFDLHPKERGKVIMGLNAPGSNCEVKCHRWHQAYLNTPKWNPDLQHSYMFCGKEDTLLYELPQLFQPFLEAVGPPFNQVVANWYQDGKDYIAWHSDYEHDSLNTTVVTITFTETDEHPRVFRIRPKTYIDEGTDEAKSLSVLLRHGTVVKMGGKCQTYFRHSVPKLDDAPRRLSLTFRAFK